MRTTVTLDDKLVESALKYANGVTTRKELLEMALREFVANHSRLDIRDLRGMISFDENYDYKSMRM